MKLIITKDYDNLSRRGANLLAAQVALKPDCVLGLATGSSPIGIYETLVSWYRAGDVDFSEVRAVNLDEYKGLPASHLQSYAHFMRSNLFQHINIMPQNTHIPDGLSKDPELACRSYDRLIEELGGVDMQLLGIGHNGHIGFNEPEDTFPAYTHQVELTQETISANARFFGAGETQPTSAFTMGIGTIMSARRVLLIASGAEKAEIVRQAFYGPVTPQVPASVLQFHPDVTLLIDEAAAMQIRKE